MKRGLHSLSSCSCASRGCEVLPRAPPRSDQMSYFALEGSPNKESGGHFGTHADRLARDEARDLRKQVLNQKDVIRGLQGQLEDSWAEIEHLKRRIGQRDHLFNEQKEQLHHTREQLEQALLDLAAARSDAGLRDYQAHFSKTNQLNVMRAMTRNVGMEKLKTAQQNRDHARSLGSLESEVLEIKARRQREVDELTNHVQVLIEDRADLVSRLRASAAQERTYDRWHSLNLQ